ncbi:MAG TPA: DNA-binding protein WhiA [Firmicutes bacterium]|uniref:Probable cell division protein WhiA n=1 Tax=Capillibacterium thermochitinicola TaxID=2699427 RepID=A0A8J6LLQ3_9FIRM|nr:DNA-binding protein WhiA [Capillibacterium thermochitinicola]HHW12792.1 DNA-binding protein WhiA [Bacillota bacterium]
MGTYSQRTKEELARKYPAQKCCVKAELAAIVRASGSLHLRANHSYVLTVSSESAALIRKTLLLLKKYFQLPGQIIVEDTGRFNRRHYRLQLIGARNVKRVLTELEILSAGLQLNSAISPSLVRNDCCRAAFLRGAFLARGSITDPQKPNYHLEITTENEEFAVGLNYLLNLCGFRAGIHHRKEYTVYLKGAETISRFISFIGAHSAFLAMEEVRVIKEMRNEVNRLVNCETANLEKSVRAGLEQVEAIKALQDRKVLATLPASLQEVARLRLEHPEVSLRELGELATPPLSKSAVNHRMRKLLKIAETFIGQEEMDSPG